MANYKLTVNDNGDVEIIRQAGNDYVRTIVAEGQAKAMIETAESVEKSDEFADFGISVNGGEFYFAGKITSAKSEPKADEKAKPVKKASASKKKA